MAKYQVTTDDGTFEVETEDSASAPQDNSALDLAVGGLPGGFASGTAPQDSPAVIASLLSGVSQGALRNIAEQPFLSAVGGPAVANFQNSARGAVDLANLIPGVNLENTYSSTGVFPEASTAKGKIAQMALETLIPTATPAIVSRFKDPKVLSDAYGNKQQFLDDVRSSFYEAKSNAVDKYGEGLEKLAQDNPDKFVDITPALNQMNQEIAFEPKLRNAVNRVPQLANFLDDVKLGKKVPIQEAQQLVNDLQSKVAVSKLRGLGVRPDEISLLDVIHDIKGQMVEVFPDIKNLRKSYGDTLNKFNLLRNKIKPGSLEKNIQTGFGDVEVKNAADQLLKEFPQIYSRIKNYNILRSLVRVATFGAEAGVGLEVAKRVISR